MNESGQRVFVIMPFAEEFYPGYRDIIKPAIEAAGLTAIRADQEPLGHIHTAMFERIFDSPIVIADISGANPNVFYELGVVHSVARKTVTVSREDFVGRVPFDIGSYRVLVYPKPPPDPGEGNAKDLYRTRVEEATAKLAQELKRLSEAVGEGVANPVQDFLASRSPLACTTSLYLDEFDRNAEEDMLNLAQGEITYVAISGASFVNQLVGFVESGRRTGPLKIKFALLDPADKEAWRFVYQLREGRSPAGDAFEGFLAEETFTQNKTRKAILRLQQNRDFSAEIACYSGPPLFWAYWIDRNRLIMGHLAQNRMSARHMPVMVLLRDDPRTESIYRYYTETIRKMTGE